MAEEEIIETEEVLSEPLPQSYPCPWCGGDGLKLIGWTDEGEDINEPCAECGGTGTLEGA